MRTFTLPVVASAILASIAAISIVPAACAQNSAPTEVVASRVWTNDDMDQLRERGLISTFSPGPSAAAQTQAAQPAQPLEASLPGAPRPVRALDPGWYAEQAVRLQAELDSRRSTLQQYVLAIQQAKSGERMTSGLALGVDAIGITPEAGIDVLQTRVSEIENQLDDLADLARHNGIPPGALRA